MRVFKSFSFAFKSSTTHLFPSSFVFRLPSSVVRPPSSLKQSIHKRLRIEFSKIVKRFARADEFDRQL